MCLCVYAHLRISVKWVCTHVRQETHSELWLWSLLVKNIAHVWLGAYSSGCESERNELQVAARIEETGEKERNILEFSERQRQFPGSLAE